MSPRSATNNKRPAYYFYPHDGLVDVFIGIMLLLGGLFIWVEMPWMPAIFIASLVPALQGAKKSITAPRLTRIGWSEKSTGPSKNLLPALLWLGVLALLLGIILFALLAGGILPEWPGAWIADYALLGVGAVGAVMWAAAAWLTGANHFYIYGGLTLATFCLVALVPFPFILGLAGLGAAILLIGLAVLIRFMLKYPAEPEGFN